MFSTHVPGVEHDDPLRLDLSKRFIKITTVKEAVAHLQIPPVHLHHPVSETDDEDALAGLNGFSHMIRGLAQGLL